MINFIRRNETLTILCIQVALVMLGLGLVSPILPQYGQSFGVSITMVGFIITIYGIARIIVDIPTANLTEKFGRRPVLIAGPLIQALGSFACGMAGSYWQLIIFRFIQGVGSATLTTSAMIMLADISSSENRGRIMSFYQGSMLLGSGLGPTLGGFVAQYFGLRAPFFALAILSLVATVWAYLRIPETCPVLEQQATPQDKNDITPPSGTSATGLKALLQNVNFMTISIVSFGLFFMRTGARSELLPLLASDRLGLSPSEIGIAMTLISVFNFLILFVCGTLSDRFGRKILITPGVILSAASIAMLSLTGSYWFLILTCIIWGIGTGISGPLPAAYVVDVIPRGSYSYGMGIYRAIGDLGFVTGPILLGWMADTKGYGFALWFNSLFLLATIIVFQLLAKEPPRILRRPTEIVST